MKIWMADVDQTMNEEDDEQSVYDVRKGMCGKFKALSSSRGTSLSKALRNNSDVVIELKDLLEAGRMVVWSGRIVAAYYVLPYHDCIMLAIELFVYCVSAGSISKCRTWSRAL